MADNMTETSETSGAEQSLNTQSEKDPNSVVSFVYVGENPYMRFLAQGLEQRGVPVNVHEVKPEAYRNFLKTAEEKWIPVSNEIMKLKEDDPIRREKRQQYFNFKRDLLAQTVGDVQGIAVTDLSFGENSHAPVSAILHLPAINGIRSFEGSDNQFEIPETEMIDKIGSFIRQIDAAGKKPVILQCHMGDHFYRELSQAERETITPIEEEILPSEIIATASRPQGHEKVDAIEGASIYTALIKKHFDLPVIPLTDFGFRSRLDGPSQTQYRYNQESNILALLEEKGLDPKETVLLIDQHVRYMSEDQIKDRGLDQVEVARVCPCCLDIRHEVEGRDFLLQRGLKLFPTRLEPDPKAIESLMGTIDQKKAELAAKETEATP